MGGEEFGCYAGIPSRGEALFVLFDGHRNIKSAVALMNRVMTMYPLFFVNHERHQYLVVFRNEFAVLVDRLSKSFLHGQINNY